MKRIFTKLIVVILTISMLTGICLPAQATELKTGIGVVTASSLRLRAKPNTESEILGTASSGDNVVIIREVGDFYLVNFNLQIGYMHKDYVEFNSKKNVKLGYAMFDTASNVRQGPTTESGLVAQAPKDETCFIIGFNESWYKVSFNGQIGYVRSDLLTLLETPYNNAGSRGNTYKENAKTETKSESTTETKSEEKKESSSESKSESSGSSSSGSSSDSGSSSGSSVGEKLVSTARQYLGYRYVYGGSSPSTGFDCSGLVYYVAKQCGYSIGRTCTAQLSAGTQISRANLQPGDIVIFERTYTTSSRATHAGIYIGNGQFIHAANSRSGVVISSLDTDYYSSRLICGVRIG